MSHNAEWEAEQAKKLIGYTIADSVLTPSGESFGLVLTKPGMKGGGVVVWVDSDQEGNDCGHLSIPTLPKEGGKP